MLKLVPLRSLRRDTCMQREAGTFRNISARLVRLRRQRLQREDLLSLSRTRRDPVRDRRPEQTVDRRLLGRIEGQIRVLDVTRSASLRLPEISPERSSERPIRSAIRCTQGKRSDAVASPWSSSELGAGER